MAVVTTPQFVAPFALDSSGVPIVCQQDSPADVASCVYNVVVCPPHAKLGDPNFGVPELLFQTIPLNTNAMMQAISKQEPRASLAIDAVNDAISAAIQNVSIRVAVQGVPTNQSSVN